MQALKAQRAKPLEREYWVVPGRPIVPPGYNSCFPQKPPQRGSQILFPEPIIDRLWNKVQSAHSAAGEAL